MIDYAEKLRNGVSWDPNYYKGTWKENTTSYQDATLYLTGRYATDSSYYIKLNAIISAYDLTQIRWTEDGGRELQRNRSKHELFDRQSALGDDRLQIFGVLLELLRQGSHGHEADR